MKHKIHHHKMFITLGVLLVMGVVFILVQHNQMMAELQTIVLFVNTLLLVIIMHFLLEMHSGNHVMEVIDVTPQIMQKEMQEIKPKVARTAPKAKKTVASKTKRR